MKKFILGVVTIVLACLLSTTAQAVTVQVGTGTDTNTVLPIRTRGYYNYSQQIYTQAQINQVGMIKSLSFYFASGGNTNSSDWDVYLGNTTKTSFSSVSDWVPYASLTQVYSGAVTISNNSWVTVTFTTQFPYDNTNNLVVAIDENTSGRAGSEGSFYAFTSGSNTGMYDHRTTNNSDLSAISPRNGRARTNILSQIKFDIDIYNPTNVTATAFSETQINLGWARNATPDNILLAWNTTNTFGTPYGSYIDGAAISGGGTVLLGNSNATSFNHTGRNPDTTYYYKIWSRNGSGSEYSSGVIVNAKTLKPIGNPTNVTATAASASQINLGWARNATPDNVIVAWSSTNSFGTPINGTSYAINSTIPGGGIVISNGSGTSFSHSSLSPNTTYYYKLWSVGNNNATLLAYSPGVTTNATTPIVIANPTNVTATTFNANQINLGWTRNNTPDNVLVAWNSTNSFGNPVIGAGYSVNNSIPGGGTVIYNGNGTSFSQSTLNPNTTYYYKFWSVSNSGGIIYSPGVSSSTTTLRHYTVNPLSISRTLFSGESAEEIVTITNQGSGGLQITNITDNANWLSVGTTVPFNLAAGNSQNIVLNLDTTGLAGGLYPATLVITTNSGSLPTINVTINLTVNASMPYNPRFVAEWEEAEGAIVSYVPSFNWFGSINGGKFGLPITMIKDLSDSGKLYIITPSAARTYSNTVLNNAGVNSSNVVYIDAPVDTYWIRDYGPMTIFSGSNMGIVDFTYNRPRANDNAVNAALASSLGLNRYSMPMIQTGGNMMTDGYDKAMSTVLVVNDNDGNPTETGVPTPYYNYSQAQIDEVMQQYLGITEYQKFTDPLLDSTLDHIDCWAKLLDVDKVMITRVPSGNGNYDATEASVAEWRAKTSSYGTPYRIYRVDAPGNQPYSNAYIYNKIIYVPQMSASPSTADNAARAAYAAAMPGYTIKGYFSTGIDDWLPTDAVHCRVNTKFNKDMIFVHHIPVRSAPASGTVSISANITTTYSVANDSTYVSYRYWDHTTSAYTNWVTVPLSFVSGSKWSVDIPTPAMGDSLMYTIRATNSIGRTSDRSLNGRLDPFRIKLAEYHYRSIVPNGNWDDPSTWEYSTNLSTWSAASEAPRSANSSSITVMNSHTVTLGSSVQADQVTIQSGGTLVVPAGVRLNVNNGLGTDMTINGSLIVTGELAFSPGASSDGTTATIEFNGNTAQTVGSGFPANVQNLIIDNPYGVSLPEATNVTGTLTQTEGDIAGVSNVDGYYSPALNYLRFPETGNNISGWSIDMSTETLFPDRVHRQWTLTGNYSGSKTLTFLWTADDDNSLDWSGQGKVPSVYIDGVELTPDAYDVSGATRSLTITIPSGFNNGVYTIGPSNDGTLPVELSSFTAVISASSNVMLQWVTQSETNVVGYRIYRGRTAEFSDCIMLNAFIDATNTSQTQVYIYHDRDILESGSYYYWLQNLDLDGGSELYGPIMILVNLNDQSVPGVPLVHGINRVYPNPFNPNTKVQIGVLKDGPTKVMVYNLRGQLVKSLLDGQRNQGTYILDWDGTDSNGKTMASGVYYIIMHNGSKQFRTKVSLVK